MKAIRLFFAALAAALTLCATSCKDSGGEKLDPFNQELFANKFISDYNASSSSVKTALIDYQSPESFAKKHLDGAINVPAFKYDSKSGKDVYDADRLEPDGSSAFETELKAAVGGDLSTVIFLYGAADASNGYVVGGRASKTGFGKPRTYIFFGGVDQLKK